MVEACIDVEDPDLVLTASPPVPRRMLGRPLPQPRETTAPPTAIPEPAHGPVPSPPPVPEAAPISIDAGEDATPRFWPDRAWWISTGTSLVVHVAVLTLLALLVTEPDVVARQQPIVIAQSAAEPDVEPVVDPVEQFVVKVLPPTPKPVLDAVVEPIEALVDDDAIDAAADGFEAGDTIEPGLIDVDSTGLVASIGGAAGAGHGAGGFGGAIGKRLARAGAKTGDIQVSLSWNNFNDLDIHVVAPSGERIFFAHRQSRCKGTLDVDMNAAGPVTREPVENIFWPAKAAPPGNYQVFVHHFARHDQADETPFDVHVLVNGRRRRYSGYVKSGDPPVPVATFTRTNVRTVAADEFVE